jgi:hypothetical protein
MINPKNGQPEFINLLDPLPKKNKVDEPAPVIQQEANDSVEAEVEQVVEENVVEQSNLEAAMNKVAETLNLTRKVNTGSKPGEPAQRQVLIRASVTDHERWKKTAEARGLALSELIRELCNAAATEELECTHPAEFRKTYKWSDTCYKCNTRLRGWE